MCRVFRVKQLYVVKHVEKGEKEGRRGERGRGREEERGRGREEERGRGRKGKN